MATKKSAKKPVRKTAKKVARRAVAKPAKKAAARAGAKGEPTKIFVNLAVQDLARSKAFFGKLGYKFNPKFTDENAACMVISDDIYAMLLVPRFFQSFTSKAIVDARASVEAILALSLPSRKAVDAIVAKAYAAGGRKYREPQDFGFMYSCAFEDPDGHLWEYVWMDPVAAANGPPKA
ncbi:MAG: uncharacterized protein QOD77_1264 [Thermoplasmata archaeon]|jgi:predicted lactoylglutathione lyase|nr:uncharacterized protein [Thermoplasmata archaeon]